MKEFTCPEDIQLGRLYRKSPLPVALSFYRAHTQLPSVALTLNLILIYLKFLQQ